MVQQAADCDAGLQSAVSQQPEPITKLVVAVHGIGDQTEFGTIQSAAYRFFSYCGVPAAFTVGNFHTKAANAPSLVVPIDSPEFRLRFAEAYWAPIPRELVSKGHTLEESKRWAQIVVERYRARYERKQRAKAAGAVSSPTAEKPQKRASPTLTKEDFSRVKQVLLEMIESIRVLERLVLVAEKAGLFKIDLRKLLDDYVGDVQVVADFQEPRSEILERFLTVMRKVNKADRDAEIYIVAHSEGTVVSFLGLLTAMSNGRSDDARWIQKVRGYMTIGSPLDKHLLLWPELFQEFELPPDDEAARDKVRTLRVTMGSRIQWKNYYDYGDPVGFNLRKIREWLGRNEWKGAFNFEEKDDYEFGRSWLPGKAHNDYWQDKDVFGHFIQNVVNLSCTARSGEKPADFSQPPRNKIHATALSYVFPYLLFAVLSFAAIFVLRKGLLECINPEGDSAAPLQVFKSVGLSTLVLAGLTTMAGIFRVTLALRWRFYGIGLFVLLTIPYWLFQWPTSGTRLYIGEFIDKEAGSSRPIVLVGFLVAATVLVALANLITRKYPSWGLKPLLFLIGAPVLVMIAIVLWSQPEHGSLWPLLLSGAGALYLWWLAALLFDLVFIWHYYVRHEVAINNLREPV